MCLCSFLCPFWSQSIPLSSVQVCSPIQHFSFALNSKSPCMSFFNFSFIQTFHHWIIDVHRSGSISLKDGSVEAFTCARVLVFWYWISCIEKPYRQKSWLLTSLSFCLVFFLQCTTGGFYKLLRVCPV